MASDKQQIGIYYGYFVTDRTDDYVPLVQRAVKLGFDALEISLVPLIGKPASWLERLLEAKKQAGIELYFTTALAAGSDIASDDAEERNRGLEFLGKSLDVVHQLEGRTMNGMLYGTWMSAPTDVKGGREHYLPNCVDSMKKLAQRAAELGITLNLEIVNRFEQFMLNTTQQGVEFLDMVSEPNVKLHLDTFHMNIEEADPCEAILRAKGRIGFFHVNEHDRRLPYAGSRMNWPGIAAALKKADYSGPIVIESVVRTHCQFAQFFRIWRDLANPLGNVDYDSAAAKARFFLTETFQ
jgi:D-psicose/D-tagatose/L-ribulose 3-epimerase